MTLKKKLTDIHSPIPWGRYLALLFTLGLFLLMVKLGFWQLQRAEEKQLLAQEIAAKADAGPSSFSALLRQDPSSRLTGQKLQLSANVLSGKQLLLDNQVYQGRVGYLLLQPLQVEPEQPWLLLELGFIPAPEKRSELPEILPLPPRLTLEGRLWQKGSNPLSQELLAEAGWPKRIQNLNWPQLEHLLGHKLIPAVLQPVQLEGVDLPRPWQPLPMPAEKHLGYALQWFSMAAALLLLLVWWRWKLNRH
ncbi:SURF1 family protein [Shewanella algae]|uniref:SURF1 family protein n=1 Tax=Shewanella algae TaxID=38313 RepID=UPI0031F57398